MKIGYKNQNRISRLHEQCQIKETRKSSELPITLLLYKNTKGDAAPKLVNLSREYTFRCFKCMPSDVSTSRAPKQKKTQYIVLAQHSRDQKGETNKKHSTVYWEKDGGNQWVRPSEHKTKSLYLVRAIL